MVTDYTALIEALERNGGPLATRAAVRATNAEQERIFIKWLEA